MNRLNPRMRFHQHGMALVTSLVFLVIMTIIGVTVVQNNTVQERMAGNTRDLGLAFEAAEAALREAQRQIEDGTATVITAVDPPEQASDPAFWRNYFENNTAQTLTTTLDNVSAQPRYVIERSDISISEPGTGGGTIVDASQDSVDREATLFQVTAIGTGATETATVILQTRLIAR